MAKKLTIKLDLVNLVRSAAGADNDKRNAYQRALRNDQIKREFGKRCIDKIIDRTLSGVDKTGAAFKEYKPSYYKSDIFKIYGKNKNKVNLKLTGEMQAAIDVIDITQRSVTLGFISPTENDKAHGHVNGANHLPVRDFWGISEKEQKEILIETLRDFEGSESVQIQQTEPTEVDVGRQATAINIFEDEI